MKNADVKRVRIIEAAKRRFSHFGMAKTTMAEIARDLSFSKALLYYYFPDKNSLYVTVLEDIINERLETGAQIITREKSIESALMAILEERGRALKDHYNIFEYTYSLRHDMPADLQRVLPTIFEKELQQMENLLHVGVERGEIEVDDLRTTAKLLLVAMIGTRLGLMAEYKNVLVPLPKEEFDNILQMQQKLGKIFIGGLKKC